MVLNQLIKELFIPASMTEVWDFISSTEDLWEITPEYLGFNIASKNLPSKMYPGMIVSYRVNPLAGIPMTWVTKNIQAVENRYLVNEQRIAPYSFWHHQHIYEDTDKGVLMTDIFTY